MAGSYTYENVPGDPDRQDVLKNRFDIRSTSQLQQVEDVVTGFRQREVYEGKGPTGTFDADHLKAIHRHIFQDVYEWAGHTRNERPMVDGQRVDPIEAATPSGHEFTLGTRVAVEVKDALDLIGNGSTLRGSSVEQFAASTGQILNALNTTHPFRHGNEQTFQGFLQQLGTEAGHKVDFSVITRPRMNEASITSLIEPTAPAMVHLMLDAVDPSRGEALRAAFADLQAKGRDPATLDIRSGHSGQEFTGTVIGYNQRSATMQTDAGIVAVPRSDVTGDISDANRVITVQVRSKFETPAGDTANDRDEAIRSVQLQKLEAQPVDRSVAQRNDVIPPAPEADRSRPTAVEQAVVAVKVVSSFRQEPPPPEHRMPDLFAAPGQEPSAKAPKPRKSRAPKVEQTVPATMAAAPAIFQAVHTWPQTIDESVRRTMQTDRSMSEDLQNGEKHARKIWKDIAPVIARLQQEVHKAPDRIGSILSALEQAPQAYGELLGGRTLLLKPNAERREALSHLSVFTSSMSYHFETQRRMEPVIRAAEVEWRKSMSHPVPSLSPGALAVVDDLIEASILRPQNRTAAHNVAMGAVERADALKEVKEWRQAMAEHMKVPNALDRIPGLSDARKTEIKDTLKVVDTAMQEARLAVGREQSNSRQLERNKDRGRGQGMEM